MSARAHTTELNVALALIVALLVALVAIGWIIVRPEDWRSQGRASCLYKDASGTLQMECRR